MCRHERRSRAPRIAALVLVAAAGVRCGAAPSRSDERPTLRLGISNAPAQSVERGIQQFVQTFLATEVLLRVNQDGHVEPALAESWERSPDGRRFVVRLRQGVRFHDGSPVEAPWVAAFVRDNLAKTLRSMYDDVESITARGDRDIEVTLRNPSSLIPDALMDMPIVRGTPPVGTGAFKLAGTAPAADGTTEVVAFDDYYLKPRPVIGKILVKPYQNNRAAWADLLRSRLDALYEVSPETMDTMRGATNVATYTFERPYQYLIFLNTRSPKLKSPAIRQALNEAIDRAVLVRGALGGYGTPSEGPVSPRHWAYRPINRTFQYAPERAAAKLKQPLTIRCLMLGQSPYEQLALAVKQQLQAVNVDLQVEAVGVDQVFPSMGRDDFEAVLTDPSSGWSLLRAYRWWHSSGQSNVTRFASRAVDEALDRVRRAVTDDEYRTAVAAFEEAMADDPPAIFIAWGARSRAVATTFEVQPQPGRDVLATLRLWHPSADTKNATKN